MTHAYTGTSSNRIIRHTNTKHVGNVQMPVKIIIFANTALTNVKVPKCFESYTGFPKGRLCTSVLIHLI